MIEQNLVGERLLTLGDSSGTELRIGLVSDLVQSLALPRTNSFLTSDVV